MAISGINKPMEVAQSTNTNALRRSVETKAPDINTQGAEIATADVQKKGTIKQVGTKDGAKSDSHEEQSFNQQKENISQIVENLNKKLNNTSKGLEFSIHEKTKDVMVKLVNTETNEVIKELPSEKIVDMVAQMCEMAGLFVDEKR